MTRIVLVVVALGVLVGCGGESTAEKAFEGSSSDGPALRAVATEFQTFSSSYTDFVAAMTDEAIPRARKAVDSMSESLDAAEDKTLDLDSTELRQTTQDYIDKMLRVTLTANRIVTYYEDDTIAADAAIENDMVSDFEEAILAARGADQKFLNRIMEHASPEEREELREVYRKLEEDFDRQVGG